MSWFSFQPYRDRASSLYHRLNWSAVLVFDIGIASLTINFSEKQEDNSTGPPPEWQEEALYYMDLWS